MNKKIFKYLFIISIPALIVVMVICSISPPDEYRFSYIKNDCSSQSLGIYKTMFLDTEQVNMAFFGSSHTLMGINDSLINTIDKNAHTVNFGYCRFGRDLHYILFKKTLEQKKIKVAIFEITETEASYSHPDYTFLGESSDIFIPSLTYNQDFLKNRYNAFLFHLAYIRYWLFGGDGKQKHYLKNYGHISHPGMADSAYLECQKEEKLKDLRNYNAQTCARKAELYFSSYYLNKIKRLAIENNCKLYFMYLPAYGNDAKNALDSAFYASYFPSLVPPDSLLNNYRNWQDEAHFNNRGATILSNWLLEKIKSN